MVAFAAPTIPQHNLQQVNAAASIMQRHVHPDANIIIGALVDDRCGKQVSVTVLATGFGVSVIFLRCGQAVLLALRILQGKSFTL